MGSCNLKCCAGDAPTERFEPLSFGHLSQVKILREAGKGAASDSGSKSKGLAFVEFTEHEHALCALRQLNNNPMPFGKCCCRIVELVDGGLK